MYDIKQDLPMSMTMAAFIGVAWYIGVEINVSLFLLFKRRQGLYFWSCALTSWGVILQPLFIILADFGVWNDAVPSVTMIYLTWLIMVIPQSWVLYSRLHLLMRTASVLRAIKFVLIFNSIVFSLSTIVIGILAQSTNVNPALSSFNLVWDRVQLFVFFAQETSLSILYIFQTRTYLRGRSPLRERSWSTPSSMVGHEHQSQAKEQKVVLWHLIYANTLIIVLDIVLVGIQCANLFLLQGAFKPCVYGIKLKVEFVILNRLINIIQQPASGGIYIRSEHEINSGPRGSEGHGARDNSKKSSVDPAGDIDGFQLAEGGHGHRLRSRNIESLAPICYLSSRQ